MGEANAFFEREKISRYGWFPQTLRLALHAALTRPPKRGEAREVDIEKLREIGRHFAGLSGEKRDAALARIARLEALRKSGDINLPILVAGLVPLPAKPRFNLSGLFQNPVNRTYRSSPTEAPIQLPALLHLLVSSGIPAQHAGHLYTTRVVKRSNLPSAYAQEVRYNGTVLNPVQILRVEKNSSEQKPVMSLHPVHRQVLDTGHALGIQGFDILVHDHLYLPTARKMAKSISRLSKRQVSVKYQEKREYRGKFNP